MMFCVFGIIIPLMCLTVHGGFNNNVNICNSDRVYLLEGQVVEWSNSVQGHGWLNPCMNEAEVVQEFNTSLIEEFAYDELDITSTLVPIMPEKAATKHVMMRGATPLGLWGGCSQLEKLEIYSPVNLTLIPPDWLINCSRLYDLTLEGLTVEQIRAVLNSVSRVASIEFRSISDIENIVWDPIFPLISGAHQWIRRVEYTFSNFNTEISAEDVTWAEISEAFVYQLSLLKNLEEILIYSFHNLDWCASANYSSVTFESLKKLSLPSSATNSTCFRELRSAPNLEYLSIFVPQMEFSELSASCAPQLKVILVGKSVSFYREDYLRLYDCPDKKSNVTLNMLEAPINCDCGQSLWLARAVMAGFVTVEGSTCSDGTDLEYQSCDWLNCTRVLCNTKCVCCDDTNYGIVADCRDAHLTTVPEEVMQINNLTELLIPNSNISTLPKRFPDSLIFADFYGNDLFRGSDANAIAQLFAVQGRMVRLAANPVICVCDNQLLIRELQRFSNQIEDYDQIVCAGQDTKLSAVDTSVLCSVRDRDALVLLVVTVALVASVSALMLGVTYYYRREIQIFLFARGWCLCCINEEELDADRRYDIFLSFCYADEQIVCNELLTKLDQEYSVCVHYRDWNPGGMIPAQIWSSVEESRRTVVVLSRHFIKSLWGILEFRSAYISGINDGRVRVVMIVLDDVLETEDLEVELRAYVKLNTYVKWGDPWFWDKLRFALPHRPGSYSPERRCPDNADVDYIVQEPELEMLALNAAEISDFDDEVIVSNNIGDNAVNTNHSSQLINIRDD